MADERNRILPPVFRTGIPIIDRNLDAIRDTFRRLQTEAGDDHEVKADDNDTGHDSLIDKLKAGAGVALSVISDFGVRKVQVSATGDHKVAIDAADDAAGDADYAEIKIIAASGATVTETTGSNGKALAIGATGDHLVKAQNSDATTVGGLYDKTVDSTTVTREVVTDGGIEKVRFNAVPPTPTTGGGSWLYTGSIQATTLLDPVKAFVSASDYSGGLAPGDASLWTVLENGDLEHKAVGQLYGLDPTGLSTFALSQGERVWCALTDGESSTGVRAGGICTVLTLGNGSTKAVLRPTADVLGGGSMFLVEGSGAEYEGWYWEVDTTSDPSRFVLIYRPSYVNTTTWNLFTSTEVHLAGSTTRETSVTIPGGTSGGTLFAIPTFEMLNGLNTSTFPKGVVNYEINAYVVSDDPAAMIFIRANLSTNLGIDHNFAYADTPPIHGTSAAVLRMQGTIPADIAVSPTDKLSITFYGHSNSASAVTIKLVYNDASHTTRVQTPLETASYGTLDHRLLDKTSKGWSAGQETFSALFEHPESTVCSRFPVDCSATIETGDGAGILVIPDTCSGPVRVTGTELRAIAVKDADGNTVFGKLAGLRLHFAETCVIRHLDALSGVTSPWLLRAAKIHLFPYPGTTGTDMDKQVPALGTIRLYLDDPSGGVLTWYIEASQ